MIFVATTSTKSDERKAAEKRLGEYTATHGYSTCLLKITTMPEAQCFIRQGAAIHLKQVLKDRVNRNGDHSFCGDDLAVLQENLIPAILHCEIENVRSQLAESVKLLLVPSILRSWSSFIITVKTALECEDFQRRHGALIIIKEFARVYTFSAYYRDDDPLKASVDELRDAVMASLFPSVLIILEYLSLHSMDFATQDGEILRIISKIFYWTASFSNEARKFYVANGMFERWVSALLPLLARHVPVNVQPADSEDRRRWAWWKAKHSCAQVLLRTFSNYIKNDDVEPPELRPWASQFMEMFGASIFGSFMQVLSQYKNGEYIQERVLSVCLSFLAHSIRYGSYFKLIKPHLEPILVDVVYPLLCINEHDEELWEDDPVEYVRSESDQLYELSMSPRVAALHVLECFAKKRGTQILPPFLTFLNSILIEYEASSRSKHHCRRKSGVMLAMGSLASKLLKKSKDISYIEQFLEIHVNPEFRSPVCYLRSRACWVWSMYSEAKVSDKVRSDAVQGVLNCLIDPELPVNVEAAAALRLFLEQNDIANVMRSHVPQLLDSLFNMLKKVPSDEVIDTLGCIIGHELFVDIIVSRAVEIIKTLYGCVERFSLNAENDNDEAEDSMAVYGCIESINIIVQNLTYDEKTFGELHTCLQLLFLKFLNEHAMDVLEETLHLFCDFISLPPTIPRELWKFIPVLVMAYKTYAFDYLSEIMPIFLVFMNNGKEFLELRDNCQDGHSCHHAFYEMFKHCIDSYDEESVGMENDIIQGCRIPALVLQRCTSSAVDVYAIKYLTATLEMLHKPFVTDEDLRGALFTIVSNVMLFNPMMTLEFLAKHNILDGALTAWIQSFDWLDNLSLAKVAILALIKLLSLPLNNVLSPHFHPLLWSSFVKLADVSSSGRQTQNEEVEDEDDDDDDGEDDEFEFDSDESLEDDADEKNDESKSYLNYLKSLGDESDLMNMDDEDWEMDSALESIDELVEMRKFVEYIQTDPVMTQTILEVLNDSEKLRLQNAIVYSHVAEAEAAKKFQEQQQQQQKRQQQHLPQQQ